MDLTQLRMFCCVAETGSVARAAEQMHRVPSNLTTRLRQLELELGADLFIREKQRLRLSPMGHNFLCYANRILALSEEAMSITHAGEPAGNFPLGSMESTAATRLPNLLAAYHQRYPKVSLSLITGTSGEIIEQVRAGTLATALVDGPVQHDELHGCRSFDEQLVIISCLERPPILQARDAVDETLFAFRPSCSYRLRLESWFRQVGVLPGHIMEIQSYHAMLACVASGAGLALIPLSVLTLLPGHERVQVHPLPPDIAHTATWLIWRKDAFSPNVRALKELIIENVEIP
ncbi:LysR family transcriptional regulator [Yersinia pestis]|uniref:LysR family transcriptional regulator n=26 Tax=Yersinia pseudotuberculosis complex TaxID=1649845 RepID=A0A3G5L1R5_YERPE|nr:MULTISPECIES: LysR family transcriptional regulator [Yersinia pseudotuberculosis complex]EDR31078.1 substrate-binding transcriptional regulator, LysR family [Yersinia pestis biovar Orientalis str. IP275]EFA46109.1 LysR substrate binding domain protein [Yersinia pestis KIM D27]ERP74933.1 LysR family transcripitonal regulator [Yersinia pestis S3]CQD54031.1 LysR family transcriptional regulator [Yersinia intermedia]AAM86219.1 putative transcriptional regulator LYSR-type [Yersinia pestis KIM10+